MAGSSLINVGDWGKPADPLIEKISGAVGIFYGPRDIKRRARAEADAAIIKATAELEINNLQ